MFIGSGTLINMAAIVVATAIGTQIAHLLTPKMHDIVTDALGLVVGTVAVLTASAIADPQLTEALGSGRPVLILLFSMIVGGIIGTALRIEERIEVLGDRVKARFSSDGDSTFTQGFVTASLLFCVGAMSILGPITEGLGQGNEMLLLKSALDFFGAMAFAAAFGWGVAFSALTAGIYQGTFTLVGMFLGNILSDAQVLMLNAVGGLTIFCIAINFLKVRATPIPLGNFLPALVIAPLLVALLS